MSSIVEESKKAKNGGFLGFLKNKKFILFIIIVIIGVGAYYFYNASSNQEKNVTVKQEEWTVKRQDLQIVVSTDGKVVAEDGVKLSFSVSGDLEVEEIFVKEGQEIKKGDKIGKVKTEDLELDLRSSYSSYQSVLADYNEQMDGASTQDILESENNIKQAELSVIQAESSLEKIKIDGQDYIEEAEKSVKDTKDELDDYDYNEDDYQDGIDEAYQNLLNEIKSINISLNNFIDDSDGILGVDDKYINDSFEHYLGVKDVSSLSDALGSYARMKESYGDLEFLVLKIYSTNQKQDIDEASFRAVDTLSISEEHLYDVQNLLNNTITGNDFTQSQLNSFKSTINSNRNSINTKIDSLDSDIVSIDSAKKSLEDYQDNYDDLFVDLKENYQDVLDSLDKTKEDIEINVGDSEISLESKKLSLEEVKIKHDDLLASLSNSELASLNSRLTSASVSLEKTRNNLDKAILTSPIDGKVVSLNYKVGDIILDDDSSPVVEIVNDKTLFIEINVEEADINKLSVGQKANAAFDALDGTELEGEISFISMTSETSNNGIVTYSVRIVFEKGENDKVREGMTAYVEFITAGVGDVLVIPVDAVRNVGGKPSVELYDGSRVEVVTGFTDGDYVEVISGLLLGDKIIY